jgi:hypothetical protein
MQVLIARGVILGCFPWPDSRTKAQRESDERLAAMQAKLSGTVTGRMSSAQPNFEELPRELSNGLIVAETDATASVAGLSA